MRISYQTAEDKLEDYLNACDPEGEIADVLSKALTALDKCAKKYAKCGRKKKG
jgi:hypothetical protein